MSKPDEPLPGGPPTWPTEVTQYPGDPEATFDYELNVPEPAEGNAEAPSRGYISRHQEVARLHAHGVRNSRIAELLQYTDTRVSLLLKDPYIQEEIARHRKALMDSDAIQILKQAAKDGARRIHNIILDPNTKDTTVLAAAQFAVEKSHGKAKQEVSVESGTFSSFMDMLREMRGRGEGMPAAAERDVQALPEAQRPDAPQSDTWDGWLNQNLTAR